ncbi:hypothetical protein D3C77_769700 [compost metagenome]
MVVLHRKAGEVGVDVDVGLDHQIALWNGAAGQDLALFPLHVHEGKRGSRPQVDLTLQHLALAGGAGAVAAGER